MKILTIHVLTINRVIILHSLTLHGMLNEKNVLYLCTLQDTTLILAMTMYKMYNQIEQRQRQILLHTCSGTL